MIYCFFSRIKRYAKVRFTALSWPLAPLSERVAATMGDDIMNSRATTKRFPIRGLRYWWIQSALTAELERRSGALVVADVGCSRGHIKRFLGETPGAEWVGLDMHVDQEALRECGYDELHQCDFDQPLPLDDNSVDVIVFSHVIEHLPRPDFTMGELSRNLKPGGVLLAGSPVAPSLIAKLRERYLRHRLETGKIGLGAHINSMDPGRWKKLARERGMQVEMMTGTFLARCSGSPLENHAWWIRFNQAWGALFPALGGEIYLAVRKPEVVDSADGHVSARVAGDFGYRPSFAWGVALLLICLGVWGTFNLIKVEACPVHALVEKLQDGNDIYHIILDPSLGRIKPHKYIDPIFDYGEIEEEHEEAIAMGLDPHFLVETDYVKNVQEVMQRTGLEIEQEVELVGKRFVVLSSELSRSK